jgi:hypothetical protein
MAHYVGQGFLHNPEAGGFYINGEAHFGQVGGEMYSEPGSLRLAVCVPA